MQPKKVALKRSEGLLPFEVAAGDLEHSLPAILER